MDPKVMIRALRVLNSVPSLTPLERINQAAAVAQLRTAK